MTFRTIMGALAALVASSLVAHADDAVSLRLNWYLGGLHVPFYYGKDKGYYAAEGIDLTINEGRGSANTVQVVAAGSDTFGLADSSSVILTASKGADVKSVMSLLNTTGFSVVSLAESGIKTPKDLEGRTVAVTPGDPLGQLLQAVCKANNVDCSKIGMVQVDPAAKVVTVLEKKADGYTPPKLKRNAIVQGHCHHKAIMRLKEEEQLMNKLELDYRLLSAGCCGMAGSFGYEKDKYDVSIKAGERILLPEVRKAGLSTLIVADGFSCKEQIEQQTNRHGLHLAEVMSIAMKAGPYGPDGIYPETRSVQPRMDAVRRSMERAGLIAAAGILGAAAVTMMFRKRRWR